MKPIDSVNILIEASKFFHQMRENIKESALKDPAMASFAKIWYVKMSYNLGLLDGTIYKLSEENSEK